MRKVAMAAAGLEMMVVGCPRESSSGAAADAAPARAADGSAVTDGGAGDAAPDGGTPSLADAGTATAPYVSKEGRFSVAAPTAGIVNATTAGVGWTVGGATFVVSYYDGKPRGVDRSRSYDIAR